jgi:adenine-specific DNA methylase
MTDTRLIERWLPIAALGEESVRERRSMTALPPTYYLHVWWARRPLVASRAAVLASVLPADADHEKFMHAIGIHGDPVASRRRIDMARRQGMGFEGEAYSYPRAFSHVLTAGDCAFLATELARSGRQSPVVLDPTAGGGSIPFEAVRLGFEAISNDLNPVAALIEKATIEYPLTHGMALVDEFNRLAAKFVERREAALKSYFPAEPEPNAISTNFLWARTIRCPYCEGVVPLSPNWRLAPNGTGVRLMPQFEAGPGSKDRYCAFDIVHHVSDQSSGTIAYGDGNCAFPDCGRIIDGDEIKRQAQAGQMGEQLYTVVFKRRIETRTKTGNRGKDKWERGYRAPHREDDNSTEMAARLATKTEEWAAFDIVPVEAIGDLSNYDRGHRLYGMTHWRDMFSPRQLLCHGTAVEVFRELLGEEQAHGTVSDLTRAAFIYLAFALDKLRDYNSRMTRWHLPREVTVNTFDSHNFAHRWPTLKWLRPKELVTIGR